MSPPPDLVAEASTPWGRVRVSVWTVRPLALGERRAMIAELGVVTTAIPRDTPTPVVLEILRRACAGPRVATTLAVVLPSPA